MVDKALFSSASDEWATPDDFFAKVAAEFGPFDLDPCATPENAKAPQFYTRKDDGLTKPWFGKVWCNPPYGRGIAAWVYLGSLAARSSGSAMKRRILHRLETQQYAPELAELPELCVMLLPARTDTKWWHEYVIPYAAEVRFIRGRLKFGGAKNSAPFPSALVVFR